MSQERWTAVDRWFSDLLHPEDAALAETRAACAAAGLPPHEVAPNQGRLLQLLARACGARAILEVGTLGGYGTTWLARALPPGGRLVTLELDPDRAALARRNLARAGLADAVEVRVGPAQESLAAMVQRGEGPFDLVFLDADKGGSEAYLCHALALSREGTLLVADNVVRDGAVLDAASTDPAVRGVRVLSALLAATRGIEATVIQTVGMKGWDGFALARIGAGACATATVAGTRDAVAPECADVTLRPSTDDDFEGFWRCLDTIARERRYLALVEAPPREQARAYLAEARARGMIHHVAVASGRVVGWCDAIPLPYDGFRHSARLGMGLLPEHRGRGLGARLLASVLAAAEAHGLRRVELEVFASNAGAIRLYERSGFVHEGVKRGGRDLDGRLEDVLCMARVRSP